MATVNLGAIKFNWQGAYNNSTSYVADDVVSSGGNSYVCILASTGNAVSNGTYWSLMAQAGTDGTDLTSTLTTQGDVLYRDGSGLQKLGAGTSGQFLKTQGTGANPVWAEAGGGDTWTYSAKQATTSGSLATFSGIPAGTRHIRVVFNNVGSTTDSLLTLRLGDAGGIETSGYVSEARVISHTAVAGGGDSTAEFKLSGITSWHDSGATVGGHVELVLIDESSETWSCSYQLVNTGNNGLECGAGVKSLSAELTQLTVGLTAGSWDSGTLGIISE